MTGDGQSPVDPEGPPEASVGPTSRWGKPVSIAGAVLIVLAVLWAVFASGWLL